MYVTNEIFIELMIEWYFRLEFTCYMTYEWMRTFLEWKVRMNDKIKNEGTEW